MIQQNIELEFKPEANLLCYFLDQPILLPIVLVSYFLGNVLHFMTVQMMIIMIITMIILARNLLKYYRECDETEVTVYADRIESEVGMKNPKLTMVEFSNFIDIKATQSYIQKVFKTYSIKIRYKSDFVENKELIYIIRDFKKPKPICDTITRAVAHAGLIGQMT